MRTTVTAVLAVAALGSTACAGQEHLIRNYGDSNRGAFAAQQQRTGEPAQPVTGLDSQEAAIISDSYRKRLAPKGQTAKQEPVLVLTPSGNESRYMPPPSVPKE